jgi:hypothetical protein
MDMIPHDTEIPQAEMELPLRLFDEREEERLELRFKKAHVVMVNFRRNMIGRSFVEHSQASHAYNTGWLCKLLWYFGVRHYLVALSGGPGGVTGGGAMEPAVP